MNDDAGDEVSELAAKLFAAARAERPGPALGRRLLLIQAQDVERADELALADGEARGVFAAGVARGDAAFAGGTREAGSAFAMRDFGAQEFSRARDFSGVRELQVARRRGSSLGYRWGVALAAMAALAAGAVGIFVQGAGEDGIRITAEHGAARGRPSAPAAAPERWLQPDMGAEARLARAAEEASAAESAGTPDEARSFAGARSSQRGAAPVAGAEASRDSESGAGAPRPRRKRSSAADASRAPAASNSASASSTSRASASPASPAASAAPSAAIADAPMALVAELALLKDARAALRAGDARRSLELLDRHASARTVNGLIAEATVLRIETLAALDRHAEASDLAERFVRDNPHSALGDRAKSFISVTKRAAP
jgi:hypothetical protein